ncbi:MAG: hypothetical protein QM775_18630 [Pirellulales bacterium]
MHGTFAGTDSAGVISELSRRFPAAGEGLARVAKQIVDALMRDNGNYTRDYARRFGEALNASDARGATVTLMDWTGENHHLGRAHAAVRLVDELSKLSDVDGARIVVWGHSHGGNVAALATRLLAGEPAQIEAFFEAASCYFRRIWPGEGDFEVWSRVRSLLCDNRRSLNFRLIVATFGTPLRYGWCDGGAEHIVHFVNHRPLAGLPEHMTAATTRVGDILTAVGGDYIQQFGIAGSNTAPPLWMLRAWLADRRLNHLLQPADVTWRNLWARISAGVRTAESGRTLLVDYGMPQDGIEQHLAGHAVYTRPAWLPFHMQQVAQALTETESATAARTREQS